MLLIVAIALVMSKSGMKETGSNRASAYRLLAVTRAGDTLCQRDELVPAGTGAVRASIGPTAGRFARLRVTVRSRGRVVARGTYPPGARGAVSMMVRPLIRHDTPASVCFTTGPRSHFIVAGEPSQSGAASIGAEAVSGDVRIVYLEPRPRSWWRFAPTAMERMGAGRRLSGIVVGILALLLSTVAAGAACAQLLRSRP